MSKHQSRENRLSERNTNYKEDEIMMNSILTIEERIFLQSLGCRSRREELKVLSDMISGVPISSNIFGTMAGLLGKLKNASVDIAYEMRASGVEIDDTTEML